MPKYMVTTRVELERSYEVEADSPAEAREAISRENMVTENDVDETVIDTTESL